MDELTKRFASRGETQEKIKDIETNRQNNDKTFNFAILDIKKNLTQI